MQRIQSLALAARHSLFVVGGLVSMVGCSAQSDDDVSTSQNTVTVAPVRRELFVSETGSDSGDGSRANPFKTIQKAADLAEPGDILSVMNGTYKNTRPHGSVVDLTRSGLPSAWITLRAYPGQHPKLKFNGWNGINVHKGASYIEILGFEVEGNIAETTLEYCTGQANVANPLCNGNGISVDGRTEPATKPHHIRIAYNDIHHCAGGGASAIHADYVTIEDNRIHDNSWYTRYATSGISLLTPFNLDKGTGYKMFIRRNRLFNNKTQVKWEAINDYSDGNGIIIDTFTGEKNPNGDYVGRTLVTNNVSIKNGGSGIHSFASSHVDIVNNTAFMNGQVVGYADIFANYSNDVNILNNIMYSRPEGTVNSTNKNTNVRYDYNLYFSRKDPVVKGPHDVLGEPLFVDSATGDFRLRAGSPAIDMGTTELAPDEDFLGVARVGKGVDVGAYEFGAPTPCPPSDGGT